MRNAEDRGNPALGDVPFLPAAWDSPFLVVIGDVLKRLVKQERPQRLLIQVCPQ